MSFACCRVSPKQFGGRVTTKSSTKRSTKNRSELFSLIVGITSITVLGGVVILSLLSPEFSLFLGELFTK